MININRERWVILLDNKKIFCGLAKHYHFEDLESIKNVSIKTYLSENKAMASFISSWWDAENLIDNGRIEFIKVIEIIKEVEDENICK